MGEEVTISISDGEEDAETVETETVEAVADASVEIAQIEADKELALEIIKGENEQALMEAQHNEELVKCRALIATLEATVLTLQAELSTPPVLEIVEEAPPNPPESLASEEVTPESPTPTVETEEASPPVEPKRKRKGLNWI